MGRIEIPAAVLAAICRRARAEAPVECCGLLLGRAEGEATVVVRALDARNDDPRPRDGYTVPPAFLAAAVDLGRREGLELIGVYHSHPAGEAIPSPRDGAEAWPALSYLIVSPAPGGAGRVRSWRRARPGGWIEETIRCRP